jgi:uncharacterized protein Usg
MSHDAEFARRLNGAGLLTAEILYYRPDYPSLLQSFVWQTLDEAPRFARLQQFLSHWHREVAAMIHSIRIAHQDWIGPAELRRVDAEFRLN